MANKNYISGRNFEYRTKYFLEKIGYFVMRAHGSKGPFDLVCFPPFVKSRFGLEGEADVQSTRHLHLGSKRNAEQPDEETRRRRARS